MRRALKIGVTLGIAASAIVVLSCEAIVSDTVPQFTCTGTSKAACPDGMYCNGSGCKACEQTDVCDHYDNDCDGVVDNGPLSDADGDGYSWCGQLDSTNHPTKVDCDDTDPDIHPDAEEICDGKDNDCSGKIDDAPDSVLCPSGGTCFNGKCLTNPCDPDAGNSGCSNAQHCDAVTHQCVNNLTVGIGQACKATSECDQPFFCADANVVGQNVLPTNAVAMCTQDCCSSSDCPSSFVCYSPGTGGHFCVDPTKIGRAGVGTEAAGVSESTATRCRSGVSQNGRCVDVCCSSANCTNGTTCSYGKIANHDTYVCITGGGSGTDGQTCFGNSACNDQLCLGYTCYGNCCTSNAGSPCEAGWACVYGKVTTTSDPVAICGQQKMGGGGIGVACTDSSTCASNYCYDDLTRQEQYCSDVCCVDSDCGAGFLCRPTPQFLHCIKK